MTRLPLLLLAAVALGCEGSAAPPAAAPTPFAAADVAFRAARFDEAQRSYEEALTAHAKDATALEHLGVLAMLDNRLDEAERYLTRARAAAPRPALARRLAETFVRRDLFARASPLAREAGDAARADQLASFGDTPPYDVAGPEVVHLPFVTKEPLPLIEARGPAGETLTLVLDTGGSELMLDPDVGARLGVRTFGAKAGTFAGGMRANVVLGALDALGLGEATVKRLPVGLLDMKPLAHIFQGRRIDGVLGTVLLYHFLSTIDYPKGELTLRMKGSAAARAFREEQRAAPSTRFWLAGDHFIVAKGTLGEGREMLWLVDTGLAGGGVDVPEATLAAAGIPLTAPTPPRESAAAVACASLRSSPPSCRSARCARKASRASPAAFLWKPPSASTWTAPSPTASSRATR